MTVLKNCEPELSYILAELFNKCEGVMFSRLLRKVSLVVPVFKNVGERSTAKKYHPVSLFSCLWLVKFLTPIWVGFLGVRFEVMWVGRGGW